ncbi:MAG: EAL domain-containing protein [Gammaproteobacteria bacterium]|nr:EAL domain-containing protein [Gammaproteobacteria bacterium]
MPHSNQFIEAILQNRDAFFRQMGEDIGMLFWLRAANNGELLYVSPAFSQLFGLTLEQIKPNPRAWFDRTHPDDRPLVTALTGIRDKEKCDAEYRVVLPDGQLIWVHDQSAPIQDSNGKISCIAGVIRDITAARQSSDQVRFLNQLYAALSRTQRALMDCHDETSLFSRVCQIAVDHGGMAMAWIGTCDPASGKIQPVTSAGRNTEYLDGINISSRADVPEGRGPTGTAFRETSAIFIQDFMSASITTPWHDRARRYGWRASAAVGIRRAGKPYAVLTLYHTQPNAFDAKTADLLQEMAANLGHGLDQLDIEAERSRYEQQVQSTSRRYHEILETSIDGFWLLDLEGRILNVNSAYVRRSGYSRDQLLTMRVSDLEALHAPAVIAANIRRLATEGAIQFESMHRASDGSLWPVEIKAVMLAGEDGRFFAFMRDLSERKRAEEEIINLGFYDPLTSLPNRRLLLERLRHAMVSSSRNQQYCAVLFIDLDHFKVINDTVGHETGDLLLKEVARRLRELVREEDTIARLGGDEFVAVLEELDADIRSAMARAGLVADKLLHAFALPYLLNGEEFICTASIGIVIFRDQESSIEDILKHSDLAMYGAKKSGRNVVRFFDPAMQHELERRTRLEADLRRSLTDQQLRLYCQSQVDQTGKVIGAEVLLRWQHPERGLVPPMDFIPFAEEIGLIIPIGQWLLREACLHLKRWEACAETRPILLSVNVSAREFRQPDFIPNMQAILAETGANPARLELEITESLLLEGIDEFIVKMREMKAMGISFALDDFGTGYSSLAYLKKLPLNQLKIDRSFVQDLGRDRSDEAIVQTIIRMSETLGLAVIAEGVETDLQRQMLQHYGCKRFQGYLFDRPQPIDNFAGSLKVARAASVD